MLPEKHIWIFALDAKSPPGGVFSTRQRAETWIRAHRLTGVLTAFPVDEGCFDWAMRHGLVTGRARDREQEARFVAQFSCAAQDHLHFIDGEHSEGMR